MITRTTRYRRAFTLIELLVVVAIISLLIFILMPGLARAREQSKKSVCGSNLRGIATAAKTYAHDNNGLWPMAASDPGLFYYRDYPFFETMGGHRTLPRDQASTALSNNNTSRRLSNSRSLWLLVRGRLTPPEQFICPSSSEDTRDPAADLARFYDFKGYGYCSYGYQMSLYKRYNASLPRDDRDPRMVLLADKSPFFKQGTIAATESLSAPSPGAVPGQTQTISGLPHPDEATDFREPFTVPTTDNQRRYNSPNHGGRDEGEGQSICRTDGSVQFVQSPTVGVHHDNIYTVGRRSGAASTDMRSLWAGWAPGVTSANYGAAGYNALSIQLPNGAFTRRSATTDSVIVN